MNHMKKEINITKGDYLTYEEKGDKYNKR